MDKSFRDLEVWQKSMELAEMYGLTGQMRRATVSIPSNVAEGSAAALIARLLIT